MFNAISSAPLPEKALLARYKDNQGLMGFQRDRGFQGDRGYTDCFTLVLEQRIHLADFVEAFYTSPLFKIERFILSLIGKPSNNKMAKELALGLRTDFAAWTVEDRNDNQILLCDFMKKTRSWLMVEFSEDQDQSKLYFGSAVVYKTSKSNEIKPPVGFSLLSRFHVWYSKALLNAAHRRLTKF